MTGTLGEDAACEYLIQNGYNVICRNKRYGHLETDVICENDECLVFAEVKTRTFHSASKYGRGLYRVNREKQRHIIRASRVFLREETQLCKGLFPRYDTVELYLDSENDRKVHVIHTPCAFGL